MSKLERISVAVLVGIVALPVSFWLLYFIVAGAFYVLDPDERSNSGLAVAMMTIFIAIPVAPVCAGFSAWFTFQRFSQKQLDTAPPPFPTAPPPFPTEDPPLPPV